MHKTYSVNENYFDCIDDEHKAYWLGFIYADGHVNKERNTFGIELNHKDYTHLEKFNRDIGSNRPIKIYNKQSTFGPQKVCRWTCSNKKLHSSLLSHGITTTKTYDGKFPKIENVEYIKDVIRGIFDGDGSITYRVGVNGFVTSSISICNTKDVLTKIEQFSGFAWSWSQRHPESVVDNWQINTGNQNNIISFLDLIYKNSNIFLDRKYKLYTDIVESRKDFIGGYAPKRQNYTCGDGDNIAL